MLLDSSRRIALSNINNPAIPPPFSHVNLKPYLLTRQKLIDRALDRYLPKANRKPTTLHRAMRYSLFAGGKRLRPILCLAAAEACRGKIDDALPLACALECIHTYSLVHDDLPSMDNDDFRRGRPTCHKVFGEGIAVLAGDALLTIAFEIVSCAKPSRRYDMSTILREVATAAGSQKLIAGQVADLEAEGKNVKRRELEFIHQNKTAAILRSSVRLGAMSAIVSCGWVPAVSVVRASNAGFPLRMSFVGFCAEGDPAGAVASCVAAAAVCVAPRALPSLRRAGRASAVGSNAVSVHASVRGRGAQASS